jgi:ABC-type sugar transport system ATPase subunit
MAERQITCLYLARRPADAFQIADRVTVLRDGVVVGTWERTDLDETAIAAAMVSQRYGDSEYADDDDRPDTGGPLGSLQTFFDRLIRPNV